MIHGVPLVKRSPVNYDNDVSITSRIDQPLRRAACARKTGERRFVTRGVRAPSESPAKFQAMCKADSDASGRAALNGGEKRQRVAIIGAGAAGMAAAWSLSRFPSKFEARARTIH